MSSVFHEDLEQAMQRQQREREEAAQNKSLVNNPISDKVGQPKKSPPPEKLPESGDARSHGVATVQSTIYYTLFKSVDSNRKVDKRHVNKLMEAIEKKNLLHLNPIVVNGDMEIIDGQHRLLAAKLLKLPIYYMIDRTVERKDISSLNSNKKNWQMMDYVTFYAKEGNQYFKQFLKLCEDYPEFKPSWMQSLCSKDGRRAGTTIKNGDIDISNIDNARVWVSYFKDYAKYIPTVYSTRFIEGAVGFFTSVKYDHPKMLQQIAANLDIVEPKALATDYTKMLKKIFNKQ